MDLVILGWFLSLFLRFGKIRGSCSYQYFPIKKSVRSYHLHVKWIIARPHKLLSIFAKKLSSLENQQLFPIIIFFQNVYELIKQWIFTSNNTEMAPFWLRPLEQKWHFFFHSWGKPKGPTGLIGPPVSALKIHCKSTQTRIGMSPPKVTNMYACVFHYLNSLHNCKVFKPTSLTWFNEKSLLNNEKKDNSFNVGSDATSNTFHVSHAFYECEVLLIGNLMIEPAERMKIAAEENLWIWGRKELYESG